MPFLIPALAQQEIYHERHAPQSYGKFQSRMESHEFLERVVENLVCGGYTETEARRLVEENKSTKAHDWGLLVARNGDKFPTLFCPVVQCLRFKINRYFGTTAFRLNLVFVSLHL